MIENTNVNKNKEKNKISTEMIGAIESEQITRVKSTGAIFENRISEWLTTKEAALYLRKFSNENLPSVNAIHKLVANGTIRRRKFAGCLFFKKVELDYLIESSLK